MFFEKLQNRKNDGFTLVELIVVIAILAILAGVTVPAYNGYVEKANIVADQTLVGEVANALALYYYNSYDDETAPKSGYVVLGSSASNGDAAGTVAMDAVFGDGWEENVKLKYSGWTSDGVLTSALTNENLDAINASPFLQNSDTGALMQNVQSLTGEAMEFLGNRTPEDKLTQLNTYASDFVDYCKDQGLELNEAGTAFKDATDAQLSNMMVLYAADSMGKLTTTDYESVLFYMITPDDGSGESIPSPEGMDSVTLLATQYTLLKSIAATSGEDGQKRMEQVDTYLSTANSMGAVKGALASYFGGEDGKINTEEELAYMESTMGTYAPNFTADAAGIAAIMGAASNASGSFYEDVSDLDADGFYAAGGISNAVDTIISVAGMSAEDRTALNATVSGLASGEVMVCLFANAIVTVSPVAANPGA